MRQTIHAIKHPIDTTVIIPGSKSITNRALLLAAIGSAEILLENVLGSDDTITCIEALKALGISLNWNRAKQTCSVQGCKGVFPNQTAMIHCHDAGTVTRFILPLLAAQPNADYTVIGSQRMSARPIKPLLDVLAEQGAQFDFLEQQDHLPLRLKSSGLTGGKVKIDISMSSQFLSGLLMVSKLAKKDLQISVENPLIPDTFPMTYISCHFREGGDPLDSLFFLDSRLRRNDTSIDCQVLRENPSDNDLSSKPYVMMTQHMIEVFAQNPSHYAIEPDASTASYFFAAAALTNGKVTVPNLPIDGLQGDLQFLNLLTQMACTVQTNLNQVTVTGTAQLKGLGTVSMAGFSDTFMTAAALAVFADSPTTLTGLAHTRLQESDRISAMAQELQKLGIQTKTTADSITIYPGKPKGGLLDSHHDHRIAMSLTLIGLKVDGITIDGAECVSKTCPEYFELLVGLSA